MEATVRDGQAPAVVVALQPGERLTSEAGAMMFVSGDISIDVEMPADRTAGASESRSGASPRSWQRTTPASRLPCPP